MENTKIEWADHTMNFFVGCAKVSPACDYCYAEKWAQRGGRGHLWKGERERTKDWTGPKRWNAEAWKRGVRTRVFTNSLSDFFDNQADPEWRRDAWQVIKSTPYLDWLILTKRPQNIVDMLPLDWPERGYANVWIGATVENQEEAERRIPHLALVPCAKKFLSCEPLLGPVDIRAWQHELDWVIVGGESKGPKERKLNLAHARSLRLQCKDAGIAYFGKQNDKIMPLPADLQLREFPR